MPPLLPLLLSYGLSPLPAVVPKPITGRVLVVGHGKSRAGGPERSVPKPPCPPWSRPGAEQPIEHGNWLCQGDQLGFQFCKNHPRARPSLPRGDSVNDARRAASACRTSTAHHGAFSIHEAGHFAMSRMSRRLSRLAGASGYVTAITQKSVGSCNLEPRLLGGGRPSERTSITALVRRPT